MGLDEMLSTQTQSQQKAKDTIFGNTAALPGTEIQTKAISIDSRKSRTF